MRRSATPIVIFLLSAFVTTLALWSPNDAHVGIKKNDAVAATTTRHASADTNEIIGSVLGESVFAQAGLSYGQTQTYYGAISAGDGGSKLSAYFDFPEDIATDGKGTFYIADTWNHRIRKISSNGTVTTFAGSAHGWFEQTGTRAKFAYPKGVAVDAGGHVYVADAGNGRIRKISPSGVTATIVSGLHNPEAVLVKGSTLYIAETGANKILRSNTNGGSLTTLSTGVSRPKKLTISSDGNTLFVANEGSRQVLQVRTATGATSVLAGSGAKGASDGSRTAATFTTVNGLTLVGQYLYVTDNDGLKDRIRKVHAVNGSVSTIASDTTGNILSYVEGITNDGSYVYVANSGNGRIERYAVSNPSSHATFAGVATFLNKQGASSVALVGRPTSIHYDPQKKYMYVITNNQFKRIIRATGVLEHVIGDVADNYREGTTGNSNQALNARFSSPFDFAVSADGKTLYISDRWNNRIRKVDVSVSPAQSRYITGAGKVNMTGGGTNGYKEGAGCEGQTGSNASGCAYFSQPTGVALHPNGTFLYVADTGNHRIRRVNVTTGATTLVAGSTVGYANGKGSLAKFNSPYGLALDAKAEYLYVADRDNHRIRKIRLSDGVVTTVAGSGQNGTRDAVGEKATLSLPLQLDLVNNHLYVSDVGALNIRVVDLNSQLVHTVSGSGARGYEEGGRTSSQFNNPEGMIADEANGVLYVADTWNDVIRKIGIATTIPYLESAPAANEVRPNRVRVGQSAQAYVDLVGSGIRYGTETYVGSHKVTTYPKSSTVATLVLPLSSMSAGYYDVRVVNIDQQAAVAEKIFAVTDAAGNVPNVHYRTPSIGNISNGSPLSPNYFTGTAKTFFDVDKNVSVELTAKALSYNAFVRVIRSSDVGLPENPGWMPASATREFQAITTNREILSLVDQPVRTTFRYDPSRLPVEEQTLNVFYFKPDIGRWVGVKTVVDPVARTVTGYHRGSSVRLKLWGKPKGDTSLNNIQLPPLKLNYTDTLGGTFVNTNGAVQAEFPAGSVQQNAFIRVFESFDHDLQPLADWTRVTRVRHFQAITSNRELIKQLRYPVKITAKYNRSDLGDVAESSLTLFYYNFDLQRWVGLTTHRDPATQTVWARYITPNVRLAVFGKPR